MTMSNSLREMTTDIQTRIRELAYLMWESAGRQQGMAMEYWLKAETEVLSTLEAATTRMMSPPITRRKKSGEASVSSVRGPGDPVASTLATAPPEAVGDVGLRNSAQASGEALASAAARSTRKPATRQGKNLRA